MIDVNNPALKLCPGMTANVNFTVASTDNVLKVANSALRYRPSDKNPEEIQKLLTSLSGEVSLIRDRPASAGSGAIAGANPPARSEAAGRCRWGWFGRRRGDWQGSDGSGCTRMGRERSGQGRSGGRSSGGAQAIIGPSKTDIYGIDAGMKIRFPQAEEARPTPAMIWVLDSAGQCPNRAVCVWALQTEEKQHWSAEISRRAIRSLPENWEMKTPEPNSVAILVARLVGGGLRLGRWWRWRAAGRRTLGMSQLSVSSSSTVTPAQVSRNGSPVISLHDIRRAYDLGEVQVQALKGVSLEIPQGQFVALMGTSGSGKSTMLNILGCLDRPTSGVYRLDGVDVSTFSPAQRAEHPNQKIGFIFQSFNLLPRTSVGKTSKPRCCIPACPRPSEPAASKLL